MMVLVAFVCVLLSSSHLHTAHAYVLQRPFSSDDQEGLIDALKLIERQRDEDYYWQNDDFEVDDLPGRFDPRLFEDYVQDVEPEETRNVDESELAAIFDDVDKGTEMRDDSESDTKTRLSTDEVAQLLDDQQEDIRSILEGDDDDVVDSTSEEAEPVEEEVEEEVDTPVEEVEEEVVDSPVEEEEEEEEEGEEEVDIPVEEEEITEDYLPVQTTTKRKRSGNFVVNAEENEALIDTKEECLRQFIELEDNENTKLAQALSLATLGQVEHTDRYLGEEIEFLRAAVDNEEKINELRECLRLASLSAPVKRQNMLEDIPEENDAIDDMLQEKFKLYMKQNDQAQNEVEDQTEESEEPSINPFYRELYEKYASQQIPVDEGTFKDFDDENGIVDEEEEEEEEEKEEEMSAHLGDYIAQMSSDEREELKEEVAEALSAISEVVEEEEEEACPGVTSLTDKCAAARQMGLALDDEALNLCDRHQLCYSCGGYFGIDSKDCDEGYLREALGECNGDADCNDEAAALFVVMARAHDTELQTAAQQAQCKAPCVLDFIVGPDSRF